MKKLLYITIVTLFSISFTSCEDMMDLKPDNEILEEDALKTKKDIKALLNSAYQSLQGTYGGAFQRYSDLMADDVIPEMPSSDKRVNIYKRYTTGYFTADNVYNDAYVSILRANLVIENIDNISGVTEAEKKSMIGEAKFIRALSHFAVLRMFAQPYGFTSDNTHLGVGLKTSSVVELIKRSSVQEVYTQIEKDLKEAETALGDFSDKAYASKWSAKALLANVYFQMHDYAKAYDYSNDVITNAGLESDTLLQQKGAIKEETIVLDGNSVVVSPSKETIFQLVSAEGTSNAAGGFGVYRSDNDNKPSIRVSKELYAVATSNSNDKRRTLYKVFNSGLETEFKATTKFNSDYANVPVLYLTQMKFVRAESAVLKSTSDLSTAITDINSVIDRAYGGSGSALPNDAQSDDILKVIRYEKRLELALEGERVYDLKRRGSGGEANVEIRGVPWNYVGLALQFPLNEINELFLPNPEAN